MALNGLLNADLERDGSYSGSLWKSPKVSKGLCPACRRLARARRSLTPALLRGPPRRAIHGPARLNRRPAGLPAPHCLRSASGLLGQSDQDQKQEHSGLPAGLSVEEQNQKRARSKCGSWLACDGINWVHLEDRVVCIAGKPAPTEKQSCISFRFGFRSGF